MRKLYTAIALGISWLAWMCNFRRSWRPVVTMKRYLCPTLIIGANLGYGLYVGGWAALAHVVVGIAVAGSYWR